jgi:hypothetical protein
MESKFNKRFLDNTEITMNGEVYKNTEAFARKNDEVCYISEGGLQELREYDHELTDKEIIEKGIGECYNSILQSCREYIDEVREAMVWHGATEEEANKMTSEELANDIFQSADWAYISTYLEERTQ